MSDQTAPLPVVPPEPEKPSSRTGILAIVASVVAVVLLAGGGFAAWRFFAGGGPQPAEVLPDSTFAVLSIDLDPSGGQKIEAIRTLRKFPSFRENTGVRPDSDVIKEIWEDTVAKECKGVDYADDVEPWIGKRAAIAGVELDKDKPLPALVVQVSDPEAARAGFSKLADCAAISGDENFGYTVGDDYAVVSDSPAHAKAIAAAGTKSPLAEDAAFQEWTEEAGGPGIVNGYVSKRAGELFQESFSDELGSGAPGGKQFEEALADFRGAGATLRFDDGGLELSVAGGNVKGVGDRTVGDHVSGLPEDTAAVIAGAVDGKKIASTVEDAAEGFAELFAGLPGGGGDPLDGLEEQTGIRLPDDLVTLLGDSFSISVGGDAPADLSEIQDFSDVPAGYLVRGDEDAVKDVVDRVEQASGASLEDIPATFDTGDGKAVLATSPDYADELLADGDLGDQEAFQDVVPRADDSPFVLFMSLNEAWTDSVDQAARSTGSESDAQFAADLKALKAFGASAWTDGDTSHALVRLTVK